MKINIKEIKLKNISDGSLINCKLLKGYTVLYVSLEFWIASKGYKLYKYDVLNDKWSLFGTLQDKKYYLFSKFKITRRLLRAEITKLYKFNNNLYICIAKKSLFKFNSNNNKFEKCLNIMKGSRPLNICQDSKGVLYFGEYFFNPARKKVNIYKSEDEGKTWNIAYTFNDGRINHIHGIFLDPYKEELLWVATGDDDVACIFGYSKDGFRTIIEKYRGKQDYRICVPLFYKDKIVYATDSQFQQNYIRVINRESGAIKDLEKIQGSGIYGVQIGNFAAISTTIEPSKINTDKNSYLWFTKEGLNWKPLISFKKDMWHNVYFQFGSIRFPNYEINNKQYNKLIVTGCALKKIDGNSLIINIKDIL
ncbi:MAG: hypothetical protein ACOX4D_05950 [Bacteroidales bacterium]